MTEEEKKKFIEKAIADEELRELDIVMSNEGFYDCCIENFEKTERGQELLKKIPDEDTFGDLFFGGVGYGFKLGFGTAKRLLQILIK